ncbi:isopentenyl transferase family protein [Saccharothrix deserti]|uniref:isopentenyl transferase family protein n=1 Tax=Saccharothrix deserti TaxID=2593674 RepID=UPI00131D44F9|nr:isopentenyl transferase family protein [Saccharothrix deserti]
MKSDDSSKPPQVHLIVGATGTGKTEVAVELATKRKAPVVVADRIQCYVDLPVTSARFTDPDGPRRYHLGARTVSDGDYPSHLAAQALLLRVEALTRHHPLVVVEGGSMSLLRRFADCRGRFPFHLTAQVLGVRDESAHFTQLRTRALQMFADGMLTEFAKAWQHREQRPFVASVNGLEALARWCADKNMTPDDLAGLDHDERVTSELADRVAEVHLEHSLEQDALFTRLFGWNHA